MFCRICDFLEYIMVVLINMPSNKLRINRKCRLIYKIIQFFSQQQKNILSVPEDYVYVRVTVIKLHCKHLRSN